MSRLDPSIPLQVRLTPASDGLDTLGKAMNLKALFNQGQLQEQSLRAGEQSMRLTGEALKGQRTVNQIAERNLKAQEALAKALQENSKIGEDGGLDIDHSVIEATLLRAGYPEQALEYNKDRLEIENLAFDHTTKALAVKSAKDLQSAKLAQSVLNVTDPDLRSGVYSFTIKQAVANKMLQPEMLEQMGLPPQYPQDEAGRKQVDAILQQIADQGSQDPAGAALARLKEARDARLAATQQAGAAADTLAKQLTAESQLLGAADDQTSWDAALAKLPEERREIYPKEFTPSARLEVVLQGLSSKDRQDLGSWKSAAEMASASAAGDVRATAALEKLKQFEIGKETGIQAAKYGGLGMGTNIGSGSTTVIGDVPPGQRNEEVLAGVNPGIADMVRGLVDGKKPYPSSMAQRQPYWEAVLRLAGEYEPGWDANIYKQRSDTIKDFTSGVAARNVTALNTVTGHLATLSKRIDDLDNGTWRTGNKIGNWINTELGDPRTKRFQLAVNAVADELERVFRGTSGSVEGIKAWKETVNAADSPEQLKGIVKDAVELMGSRIEALRDQRAKGIGRSDDFTFLTPKSRKILEDLKFDVEAIDPAVGGPEPSEADIRKVMNAPANKGATREEVIAALKARNKK